jgi:succinyl-diaminopimelate desuccinylase
MNEVELTRDLVKTPSVTPEDGGAQTVLIAALTKLGFRITKLKYENIENFYARIGTSGPHLCFAGHTDVVPEGLGWTHAPFAATIDQQKIFGRGACDMKGAIAAFATAVSRYLAQNTFDGSISFLMTGDEEGDAINGTVRVLEWMAENNEIPDFCLVGEPTNPLVLGDAIKIGRRGSMNVRLTVNGTQGHVAYPQRADNPIHRLLNALHELTATPLDQGSAHFEPSSLQVTSIDVGNATTNLVPGCASAKLNIRFNDLHSSKSLTEHIHRVVAKHCPRSEISVAVSGESFLTAPGQEISLLQAAIARVTGRAAKLDTGGGTSDARFISRYTKVAEFGLVGESMHKVDEHVAIADLTALTEIYLGFITDYFAAMRAAS